MKKLIIIFLFLCLCVPSVSGGIVLQKPSGVATSFINVDSNNNPIVTLSDETWRLYYSYAFDTYVTYTDAGTGTTYLLVDNDGKLIVDN